jgi:uncharacterized protein (DUF1330 family)
MPKGYVIVVENVHDPEGMEEYSKRAGPAMQGYEVKVLAVDASTDVREGEWLGRTVLLEFESAEAARSWYESPAYQEAMSYRQAAADCQLVIVEGFAPNAAPGS